ncbi:MAG: hypothetical protein SPH20_00210, partial [Eubacterium sp.]|nr:hypothetical protein [Eubacterium sp.]
MADTKKSKSNKNKKHTSQKPAPQKPVRYTKAQLEKLEEEQREIDAAVKENKTRVFSVIIFTVSVLFFFIAVLTGDGVWNTVHNAYIGLFGWIAAILLPILSLIYSALVTVKNTEKKMFAESICILVLVLVVSTFVFVVKNSGGGDFIETVKTEFREAPFVFNGGLFGGALGWLLL